MTEAQAQLLARLVQALVPHRDRPLALLDEDGQWEVIYEEWPSEIIRSLTQVPGEIQDIFDIVIGFDAGRLRPVPGGAIEQT